MKKRMSPEKNTRQSSQLQGTKYKPQWAESSRKSLAPYSHRLAQKRLQWSSLNIHIFAGPNRWKRADSRNESAGPGCGLVLPEGGKPEQFRWPVFGCQVFVVMNEHDTKCDAEHFGRVLHDQGANLIVLVYGLVSAPHLFVYDEKWWAS